MINAGALHADLSISELARRPRIEDRVLPFWLVGHLVIPALFRPLSRNRST